MEPTDPGDRPDQPHQPVVAGFGALLAQRRVRRGDRGHLDAATAPGLGRRRPHRLPRRLGHCRSPGHDRSADEHARPHGPDRRGLGRHRTAAAGDPSGATRGREDRPGPGRGPGHRERGATVVGNRVTVPGPGGHRRPAAGSATARLPAVPAGHGHAGPATGARSDRGLVVRLPCVDRGGHRHLPGRCADPVAPGRSQPSRAGPGVAGRHGAADLRADPGHRRQRPGRTRALPARPRSRPRPIGSAGPAWPSGRPLR